MIHKRKAAPGWHREAALKTSCECHFSPFLSRLKACFYRLAALLNAAGVAL
jgi:hypothetical protein